MSEFEFNMEQAHALKRSEAARKEGRIAHISGLRSGWGGSTFLAILLLEALQAGKQVVCIAPVRAQAIYIVQYLKEMCPGYKKLPGSVTYCTTLQSAGGLLKDLVLVDQAVDVRPDLLDFVLSRTITVGAKDGGHTVLIWR